MEAGLATDAEFAHHPGVKVSDCLILLRLGGGQSCELACELHATVSFPRTARRRDAPQAAY